jgi:hypothetical protein
MVQGIVLPDDKAGNCWCAGARAILPDHGTCEPAKADMPARPKAADFVARMLTKH